MGRIDQAPNCVACPWCKTKPVFEFVRHSGDKHDVLYCPNFEDDDESKHCPAMPSISQKLRESRTQMSERWNALYTLIPRPNESPLAAEVERLRQEILRRDVLLRKCGMRLYDAIRGLGELRLKVVGDKSWLDWSLNKIKEANDTTAEAFAAVGSTHALAQQKEDRK